MRILLVSDLHYRLPHLDWLVRAAADVDVVVVAGDLASIATHVPVEVQAVVLQKYLTVLAESSTVFVSSGNHDLDGPGPHGEQVAGWLQGPLGDGVHGDGASVDLGDVRFTVCPWWDGPVTKEAVAAQLAAAAVDRPRTWVWVYHAPPAGTRLCFDGRRAWADEDLAGWVAEHRPDIVLCGHVHQAPWVEGGSWHDRVGPTWVFNAGKQMGPVPPHVTLDLDAGTAEWFGVFETQTIELSGGGP